MQIPFQLVVIGNSEVIVMSKSDAKWLVSFVGMWVLIVVSEYVKYN